MEIQNYLEQQLQIQNTTRTEEQKQCQIYYRSRDGLFGQKQIGGCSYKISDTSDIMAISQSGEYILIAVGGDLMFLYENERLVQTLTGKNIQHLEFAMGDQFIIIIDKIDNISCTCRILDLQMDFQTRISIQIGRFSKQIGPQIQFDLKRQIFFILCGKELRVYNCIDFEIIQKIQIIPNQSVFSISKGIDELLISVVELKQALQLPLQPSQIQIWKFNNLVSIPIIEKDIHTTQEVNQLWSRDGQYLLIWTQLLDDESNQSYYGQHTLYHLNIKTSEFKEIELFDGPIHDISWDQKSKYFIVSSGFMPSCSILFDQDGIQLYLLHQHHVNTIKWCPNDRYVCLAGFGNLPGEMEVWDLQEMKLLSSCRKDKVATFQWSPCGNYFMIATTFPRLRVNNMFQIYNINGKLVYEQLFEQLYEVKWRPGNFNIVISINLIENEKQIIQQKKTLNIQRPNFVKELQGSSNIITSSGPLKLNNDQSLKNLIKQKKEPIPSDVKLSKPQTFIMRNQNPIDYQQNQEVLEKKPKAKKQFERKIVQQEVKQNKDSEESINYDGLNFQINN